jgi:hypothetical protein
VQGTPAIPSKTTVQGENPAGLRHHLTLGEGDDAGINK